MIRIAVVEDDKLYQKQLSEYISKYSKEKQKEIQTAVFDDGYDLIERYSAEYDIILLDVMLKTINGIQVAEKIRKYDSDVIIIFITNMAEFAISGYSVNALDYVLKPVHYFAFEQELNKAIKRLEQFEKHYIAIRFNDSVSKVELSSIRYIESRGHNITIHGESRNYEMRGTMKKLEEELAQYHFSRCNNCYLVNLRHVQEVNKNVVILGSEELLISRPRKKQFLEDLTDYLGGK